ncbi:MAG TPA: NAD-dependent epimerase/dehydratase family protein [Actinobacteria bacterium]|nr:dTDP-glucose 4,6-dehydratase 2 [bacterium BMS3Bbin01]HDH27453.1 NAD-dependent epimerase/dehydratase family protein [Actinomycetota bacterium]
MNNLAVVTGASGHLGANLVRRLIADERPVRVVLLPDDPAPALAGLDIERVAGDVLDEQSLRRAFRGAATVFHLAGIISIEGGYGGKVVAVNVGGVRNAAEAALAERVDRFVHCSSIHAFDPLPLRRAVDERRARPLNGGRAAYDRSKAAGEVELHKVVERGLDAVTINPTGVIGPYDFQPSRMGRVLLMMRAGRLPVLPDGGFNWVDVRDVAEALLLGETKARAGESYIAAGHWQSMRDIAELVAAVTGTRVPPVIPMGIARFGAPLVGFVDRRLGRDPLFTAESVRALRTYRHIDHAKATRTFGYMPRPTRDTIEDVYRWFAEAGVIEGVRAPRLGVGASLRAWWGSVSRKGVRRQSV